MNVRNYLKTVTPSAGSGQALSEAKGLVGFKEEILHCAALRSE
jgi:hypothetical protein